MSEKTHVPAPLRVAETRPNGEVLIIGPERGLLVGTVIQCDRRYPAEVTARLMVEAYNAHVAAMESTPSDTAQGALFPEPAAKPPSAIAEGR